MKTNQDRFTKDMAVLAAAAAILGVLLFVFGCAGTQLAVSTPDSGTNIVGTVTFPLSTNVDASVTGGGNTVTGDWSAGIVITFKQTPPDYVVREMKAAGGVPAKDNALSWLLPSADPKAERTQKAVGAALSVPGTVISRLK